MSRRRMALAAAGAVVLFAAGAMPTFAQSLGEVARREAERRKQPAASRVYTNDDLPTIDPPTPVPPPPVPAVAGAPPAATVSSTSGEADAAAGGATADAPAKAPPKAREKRDEAYWRARATDVRARLERATRDLEGTQARLTAMDSGPQTPATARERAIVAEAVGRLQSDVRFLTDEVSQLNAHASTQKIPAEWIR